MSKKGAITVKPRSYIRTREEIKFLILTCMQYLTFPVSFPAMVDICTWCDEGFDYFSFEECFKELAKTGHTEETMGEKEKLFAITDLGRKAAVLFADNLPFTVRQAAETSAMRVMRQIRRDADVITYCNKKGENDYEVTLGLKDVLSLTMSVSSETQGDILQSRFKKEAEKIFQEILESLTKQR